MYFLQACASTLQCNQSRTLLLLLLYAALQGYWGAVFNSLVYSFSWPEERSPNSLWTQSPFSRRSGAASPTHQAVPLRSITPPSEGSQLSQMHAHRSRQHLNHARSAHSRTDRLLSPQTAFSLSTSSSGACYIEETTSFNSYGFPAAPTPSPQESHAAASPAPPAPPHWEEVNCSD